MATLTSVEIAQGTQPRMVHAGAVEVVGTYSTSAALSVGDVIQMVKIPTGAVITDATCMVFGPAAGGAHTWGWGDGSLTNRFGSVQASSTTVIQRMSGAFGFRVSLSDDNVNRFDTIDLFTNAIASAAAGYIFTMIVRYVMPPAG